MRALHVLRTLGAVPRAVRVTAASVVGTAAVLTAVIGFAHTKPGRPLLAWLGHHTGLFARAAGCPLGYDRAATPEQREAYRARFARLHSGAAPAAARPALGFALDRTTRADVMAWAGTHGLACAAGKGAADLSCESVPDALVPDAFRGAGAQSVWFTFGTGDRLVAVIAVAQTDAPGPVQAAFTSVTRDLAEEAGPPARVEGTPESLPAGTLYQATAEYRFRNYYAVTRATNLGHGYALTEEYRSLPD